MVKELYESFIQDDLDYIHFISVQNKLLQHIREKYQHNQEIVMLCRETIFNNAKFIKDLRERIEDNREYVKKLSRVSG